MMRSSLLSFRAARALFGLILVYLCVFATPAFAQTPTYLDGTGVPGFSTTFPIENGFINISNGNIHFEIGFQEPIQRGNVSISPRLVYDSRLWEITAGYSWVQRPASEGGGWRYVTNFSGSVEPTQSYNQNCYPPQSPTYPGQQPTVEFYVQSQFEWVDPASTHHLFGGSIYTRNTSANCPSPQPNPPTNFDIDAQDGSGLHMHYDPTAGFVITDKHGSQVCCSVLKDNNGNEIFQNSGNSSQPFQDTSNRNPILTSQSGSQTYVDVLTYNGARARYTITYETINVSTNFQQQAVTESSGTMQVVSSLGLPDGTSYQFQYDSGTTPGHYGEITQITLPNGGAVNYGYGLFKDSYNNVNHWLISRTTSDGAWKFTPATITLCSSSGTGCQEKITVTAPASSAGTNDTVYTQTLSGGSWNTVVARYSGSSVSGGALLAVANATLSFNQTYSVYDQFVTKRVTKTTLVDVGLSSSHEDDYDTATGSLLLASKDFDFTSCASGSTTPNRSVSYTYSTQAGFAAAEIKDRVSQQTVTDCSGNPRSQIYNYYDENPVVPTANAQLPQLAAVSGSRGNLTTTSRWLDTNNSLLSVHYSYDSAGQLLSSIDENGKYTVYQTDNSDSYITSVTTPQLSSGVSLTTNSTYDPNTGLQITALDANGNRTTTTYDNMLRPLTITPPQPEGAVTNYAYSPSYSPGSTVRTRTSNTSPTETLVTHYDGYGRADRTALNTGAASGWYVTDTCFDSNGRTAFSSYPYGNPQGFNTAKICSGSGGETTTYEALGRTARVQHGDGSAITYRYKGRSTDVVNENNVERVLQSDSMGRQLSACEVTSTTLVNSGSPAACGLDYGATGYLTTYAYDFADHLIQSTQGAQARSFAYDSLGRPTSSNEPERGLTTVTYAYNSTGLAVTRQKPKQGQSSPTVYVQTTTQYDQIGRVISITNSDPTPNSSFLYDVSANWGNPQTNLLGQMSMAYRSGPRNGSGTIFSYDQLGRETARIECLPSSCNQSGGDRNLYYTYDGLGNVLTSTDGTGVQATYTYSSASEALTVASSLNDATHPGALVSSASYGPFGPTTVQYGNGTVETPGYGYAGDFKGTALTKNGTALYRFGLGKSGPYVINSTDTVNGSWTYGYDALNRLSSASNSTSGQSFSYGYDRFGNRWQQNAPQGGPAPQLSFATGTNQSTTNQVQQFSYDAAGNMLNDGMHSYTYDDIGNVTDIDGGATASYAYDAFNNRVRIDAGGGATEFMYDGAGRKVSQWDGFAETPIQGFTYWDRGLIAFHTASETLFVSTDAIGTNRFEAHNNGSSAFTLTTLPFGDGAQTTGSDAGTGQVAALDRDGFTATAHATFRQYSAITGRWMSPDPYDDSMDSGNPQSLNRYSYAMNSPLVYTDSTGQFPIACGFGGSVNDGVLTVGFGVGIGEIAAVAGAAGCAIAGIEELFHLFARPKFNGSLQPRPEGTGTPDWNSPVWSETLGLPKGGPAFGGGGGIGSVLGLPSGGCEFGACGGSFTGPNTSGAYPNGGDPADLNLFGSFFSALKDTIFGKKPSDRCVDEAKTAQANYVKASPHSRTIGLFGGVATSGALNSVPGGAYLGYQFGQAPIDAIYTSTLRSCTAAGH